MRRAALPPGYVLPPGTKVFTIKLNNDRASIVSESLPKFEPAPIVRLPRYEVAVPGWVPPLLNALTRGKIRDRIRLTEEAHAAVALACRAAGVAPAWGKRRVGLAIDLAPARREFDVDAPWKALLDGLVGCGALRDDSCRWCELGPIDLRMNRPADHTIIILEDVGEPADAL